MLRIVTASIIFVAAIFLHLLWCRYVRKPGRLQFQSFFVIAAFGWMSYIVLTARVFPSWSPAGGIGRLPLNLSALVLYVSFMPVYLILYASAIIDSPTRTVIFFVKENGPVTYEQLRDQVTEQKFFSARLNKLVEHGYVDKNGDSYRLSGRALGTCRILKAYQKIIGRNIGG